MGVWRISARRPKNSHDWIILVSVSSSRPSHQFVSVSPCDLGKASNPPAQSHGRMVAASVALHSGSAFRGAGRHSIRLCLSLALEATKERTRFPEIPRAVGDGIFDLLDGEKFQ